MCCPKFGCLVALRVRHSPLGDLGVPYLCERANFNSLCHSTTSNTLSTPPYGPSTTRKSPSDPQGWTEIPSMDFSAVMTREEVAALFDENRNCADAIRLMKSAGSSEESKSDANVFLDSIKIKNTLDRFEEHGTLCSQTTSEPCIS
jgi:hypothetical protein